MGTSFKPWRNLAVVSVFLALLAMNATKTALAADAGDIGAVVKDAHAKFKSVSDGKNADYIPYLAKVPSEKFGVTVVTADGQVFEAGDTAFEFAIESISKVFTLARVMEEIGPAAVHKKIGADPTGLPFNSVVALELHKGAPLNPLVNAGAIATTSLVPGSTADERWSQIIGVQEKFAGRQLKVNDEVYKSESDTNQHNRAIAYLLQSAGYMYSKPMEATDLYTRQCSVAITTKDLAVMGATLAAKGVNPMTNERIVKEEHVPHILAEMAMSGLYDSTGDWQYNVGLPAKSGVGGGIVAVVPGKLAIAAFSPPLDQYGNSVRAQKAIAYIAEKLGFNLFAG